MIINRRKLEKAVRDVDGYVARVYLDKMSSHPSWTIPDPVNEN